MKEKVLAAIADMKTKIERDSEHVYRNTVTGEMYQGVSTVSNVMPKEWLAAWGAKEAVKALGFTDYTDYELAEEVWAKIKACKEVKEYVKILTDAKGASRRKSKKAMLDGKTGHTWLEKFVDARITGKDLPKIPTGDLARPINQFLKWENENVDYWIASEAYVVRPDKSYAGQLDGIYMSKTGRLCLCDFKFASHVSEDYYLQTGGYAACFEPYGILFDDRVIVRLPKTLETDEWNNKTFKYEKVPNEVEIKVVPTLYEADKECFFAALKTKGWVNYVLRLSK